MGKTLPRYDKIVQALTRQRKSLKRPVKLAAETELAEEHQVARATIRRALKVLEKQGAVTRRRGRGTFLHPHRTPLKRLQGSLVGFIPPWWADSTQEYYTSTVFDGVCRWADERHCNVAVVKVERYANDEHQLLSQIDCRDIEGLIWVHPVPAQAPLVAAVARHMPCVAIGREYPDVGLNTVVPDYDQATQLIDDHLVALGHEEYSVIGRDTIDPQAKAFAHGFRDRFAARRARFGAGHYVSISAIVLTSSSYLLPLLKSPRFHEAMDEGLSVMAFDYGTHPMDLYWPGHKISHVACDWSEIGAASMDMLVNLVNRHDKVPRVVRQPVHLVTGETTRAPSRFGATT